MFIVLLFVIAFGVEEDATYIDPDCRFAADDWNHYYPIGACESNRIFWGNKTIEYSVRYICDESNQVKKEKFEGLYCEGEAMEMNATEIVRSQCDVAVPDCSYAMICSLGDCQADNAQNETNCDLCMDMEDDVVLEDLELHCLAYITGECYGVEGYVTKASCSNDLAILNYYLAADCSGNATWTDRDGGSDPDDYCREDFYSGGSSLFSAECVAQTTTLDPMTTVIVDPCDIDSHDEDCPDHDHGDFANRFGVVMALWMAVMSMFLC